MSDLGSNIRRLRNERNISQTVLGKYMGTDKTTVSKWENDIYEPSPVQIGKLATFFDVSTDFLLGKESGLNPDQLDLKEIKKALLEKELVYDGHQMTKEEQEGIRSILLAVIEREEKKANNN